MWKMLLEPNMLLVISSIYADSTASSPNSGKLGEPFLRESIELLQG